MKANTSFKEADKDLCFLISQHNPRQSEQCSQQGAWVPGAAEHRCIIKKICAKTEDNILRPHGPATGSAPFAFFSAAGSNLKIPLLSTFSTANPSGLIAATPRAGPGCGWLHASELQMGRMDKSPWGQVGRYNPNRGTGDRKVTIRLIEFRRNFRRSLVQTPLKSMTNQGQLFGLCIAEFQLSPEMRLCSIFWSLC